MLKILGRTPNLVKSVRNFTSKIPVTGTETVTKVEDKVKETLKEKWLKYWKMVVKDYSDVAKDVYTDIKQKPVKAVFIASSFAGIYYCAKHNPDETDFRDTYLKAANEVLLVDPSMQRKETVEHLNYIEKHYNSEQIRRLNCLVASIIWTDRFSENCNVYEAQCTYLQVQYKKFSSRILDVGFLDKWWILSDKMLDYDINY